MRQSNHRKSVPKTSDIFFLCLDDFRGACATNIRNNSPYSIYSNISYAYEVMVRICHVSERYLGTATGMLVTLITVPARLP